jgi:hypothetical protein
MVDAVLHMLVAVLPQHLEDGQVLVALDQRQHGGRGVAQRVEKTGVRRIAQRVAQLVQAIGPQAGQFVGPGLLDPVGRALQLDDVDQRTAVEQGLHLIGGLHHMAAGQQQRAIVVPHIERQGCAHFDALLDQGEG